MMTEKFYMSLKKGQVGEKKVIERLQENGIEVKDLTNYSEHKYYQKRGIDAQLKNRKTNVWENFDVKSNIMPSGLAYIEMTKPSGDPGWLYKSKSDWIFHYCHYEKDIYFYRLDEMQNYIKSKERNNSLKISPLKDGSYGHWMPIKKFNKFVKKL